MQPKVAYGLAYGYVTKSFGLSCEYAKDTDDWIMGINGRQPKFIWVIAI